MRGAALAGGIARRRRGARAAAIRLPVSARCRCPAVGFGCRVLAAAAALLALTRR